MVKALVSDDPGGTIPNQIPFGKAKQRSSGKIVVLSVEVEPAILVKLLAVI